MEPLRYRLCAMSPRPHTKSHLTAPLAVVALALGCESAPAASPLDVLLVDPVDSAVIDNVTDAPDVTPPIDRAAPDDAPLDVSPLDVAIDAPHDATATDVASWDAGPAPCAEVDRFVPLFGAQIERWTAQDALAPWAPGAVVCP